MAKLGKRTIFRNMSAAVVASFLFLTLAADGQIVNGSFEMSDPMVTSGFRTFPNGGGTIPGWTVGGSVDLVHSSHWPASDGERSVDLTGFSAGSVSQTIETVPGVTYTVTFDMSGNPEGQGFTPPLPTLMTMVVSATGSPSSIYEYDVVGNGNTTTDMKFQSKEYTFTATMEATELTFASQMNFFFGPVIDNVAIAASATVCHRNNGTSERETLTVGIPAIRAHIAHGDTPGPCPAE